MKLIGLQIVRNSAWCLRASATAALRWCDALVILDHASTDATPGIIDRLQLDYPGRIRRVVEHDLVWREMQHRQWVLTMAREFGATHCAIIDDDEILTENRVGTIRQQIESMNPGEVYSPPWVTVWDSLDTYRADGRWQCQYKSFGFADVPVLCWQTREGYDHHHTAPFNCTFRAREPWESGGLMHLQHVSRRRLLAKQALYQMIERIRWPDRETVEQVREKYSQTVDREGMQLEAVPAEWWGPEKNMLLPDEEPWQEAECRRMVQMHGRETFAGCDLFGVV
jgi:hypothetical protein